PDDLGDLVAHARLVAGLVQLAPAAGRPGPSDLAGLGEGGGGGGGEGGRGVVGGGGGRPSRARWAFSRTSYGLARRSSGSPMASRRRRTAGSWVLPDRRRPASVRWFASSPS